MGATRRQIAALINAESLLLAAGAGSAGIALGYLLSRVLAALPLQGLRLPHLAPSAATMLLSAAGLLVLLLVTALAAAALPVQQIGAADPYDAIRSGS